MSVAPFARPQSFAPAAGVVRLCRRATGLAIALVFLRATAGLDVRGIQLRLARDGGGEDRLCRVLCLRSGGWPELETLGQGSFDPPSGNDDGAGPRLDSRLGPPPGGGVAKARTSANPNPRRRFRHAQWPSQPADD